MLTTILSWAGSLLGGPFAKAALDAYKSKLDATSNHDARTAELAARELAIQQRETELSAQIRIAEIGKWYEPSHLFAYIIVIYFGKIVIWDKVLALGRTDTLEGIAAEWAGIIMAAYFGKRGLENIVTILKRK